jgi:hypothetical protein
MITERTTPNCVAIRADRAPRCTRSSWCSRSCSACTTTCHAPASDARPAKSQKRERKSVKVLSRISPVVSGRNWWTGGIADATDIGTVCGAVSQSCAIESPCAIAPPTAPARAGDRSSGHRQRCATEDSTKRAADGRLHLRAANQTVTRQGIHCFTRHPLFICALH